MAGGPVAGRLAKSFTSRVLVPVVAVTLSTVLLAALGLHWTAARSDAISIERQVREARQAISSSLDDLALNQETIAVWDDPVVEFRKDEPDWQWFDENFGTWLHSLFGHNHVYILDEQDVPIYAAIAGARGEGPPS
jgi:sensor domain CHASE-containing protein